MEIKTKFRIGDIVKQKYESDIVDYASAKEIINIVTGKKKKK